MSDDDFTLTSKYVSSSWTYKFTLTHKNGKDWEYHVCPTELDRDPKLHDKIVANLRKRAEKEVYEDAEESREKAKLEELLRRFMNSKWNNSKEISWSNEFPIQEYPDTYEKFTERYPTKEELEEKRRKELLERHKDDDNFGMF